MRRFLIAGGGILAILLASAWVSAQNAVGGNPQHGKAIYEQHCLRCHGAALDGEGPAAGDLTVPPANFLSPRSRSKSDWELLVTISHGIVFSPMHEWRTRLKDDEMKDVLSYVRTIAPFLPMT
jgi:cytochrome c oxidase cbb3-type subunit 3